MAVVSKYQPAWEILKANLELKVIVKVPTKQVANRAEKERLVKAFRKAVSKRKEVDYEFQVEYPSARIYVAQVNWDTMEVTLQLTNLPESSFFIPEMLSRL